MRRTLFTLGLLGLFLTAMAVGAAPSTAPVTSAAGGRNASFDAYQLILNRNIFSRDRTSSRPARASRETSRTGEQGLMLTGVAEQGDISVAFFEDLQSGQIIRALEGQAIGEGEIVAISLDSVQYRSGDQNRQIVIGQNLTGSSASLASTRSSSQPAEATSQGALGQGGNDILERMRQRRLQEQR